MDPTCGWRRECVSRSAFPVVEYYLQPQVNVAGRWESRSGGGV